MVLMLAPARQVADKRRAQRDERPFAGGDHVTDSRPHRFLQCPARFSRCPWKIREGVRHRGDRLRLLLLVHLPSFRGRFAWLPSGGPSGAAFGLGKGIQVRRFALLPPGRISRCPRQRVPSPTARPMVLGGLNSMAHPICAVYAALLGIPQRSFTVMPRASAITTAV